MADKKAGDSSIVSTLCLKKTTLMLQAISSTHINRFL